MFGAGAAGTAHLLLQGFARSKYANGGIAATDPRLGRVVFHRDPVEFDAQERLRELRLQSGGEVADALAHRSLPLRGRLGRLDLLGEGRELLHVCRVSAVVIGDTVPEHSVEPGHDGLLVAQRFESSHAAHESLLQDVFGECSVAHTSLEEFQELAVIVHQRGDDRWARGSVWRRLGGLHELECSSEL